MAVSISFVLVVLAGCRPCRSDIVRKELVIRKEFIVTGSSYDETSLPVSLRYDRLGLAGGLESIISPIAKGLPVTLSLWVRAGSDHEPDGAKGVSHVARHVLLDASVAPGAAAAISKIRLGGGSVESWTTRRWSVLQVRAPSSLVDAALTVVGGAVSPLGPGDAAVAMAAQAAASDADRWHDDPALVGADRLHSILTGSRGAGLYPDPAEALGVTAAQVADFFARGWSKERMVLGAALGEEDIALLSALPAPPVSGLVAFEPELDPPEQGPVAEVVSPGPGAGQGPGGLSAVVAGLLLPAPRTQDGAIAEVLATALGSHGTGGILGHLPRGLFAEDPAVSLDIDDMSTLLTLSGDVDPGQEQEAVESLAIALAISLVLTPGDAEMGHAAARLASGWMTGMTDPFRAAGLLARHEIVMTGSVDPEDHLGAILGATGADGARIAAAIEPAHLGFVVVPAPGLSATLSSGSIFDAASSGVDVVFETSRSASEACEPRDGIASSDVGGIRIVARRTEGSGAVAVTGLVAAGALAESPAASGTSKLLSVLMARSLDGAVNSSPALDPAFVRTGSVYAADHVGVFVEAPPEALVAAVLAVRSALLAPAMDVDSFESARQLCIAESGMAPPIEVQALRDAYGSILALGSSLDPEGSVSTLGGLTRQSVMQFHSAALKRGAVISVAGEVDPLKGCHACSVAVLAPLAPDAQPATLASPSPVVPVPAGTTVVQGPGSDAVIVIAYPVEGISHESRWAIEALAKLLDGPSGILTREIVVERALAQKCSASYWGTEQFGIVTLTVRAPATNVLAVVNILPVVVGEAIGEPPTDEQMQAVRAALLSVRAHDLALPGPASKTLALEVLLAGGAVDLEADEKSMAGLEAENVTDVLEAFFDNLNPIIVALAP